MTDAFLAAMPAQERPKWSRSAREPSDATTSSSSSPPTGVATTAPSSGPQRKGSKGSGTSPTRKEKREGKTGRKKVAKACLSCQKSHLTCDEARPCTRCMKKGIGDQCVEGVRKKAKYLMEGNERTAEPRPQPATAAQAAAASAPKKAQTAPPPPFPSTSPPNVGGGFGNMPVSMLPNVIVPAPPATDPVRVPDNIWLTAPLPEVQAAPAQHLDWGSQNNDLFNFPSSAAANLEYEMFDSMFGSLSPSFPLGDLAAGNSTDSGSTNTNAWSNFGLSDVGQSNNGVAKTISNAGSNYGNPGDVMLGGNDMQPVVTEISPTAMYGGGWQGPADQSSDLLLSLENAGKKKMTPEDVYRTVLKPYDYTEGYHILMQYLTQNFDKPDILRVVRALAAFRPSLIALQMPMSEEDEVFLERSFQRTLIELEKLISYSATPTAVWRRTGEVVCVAPSFSKLVGKTEDELIRNRTCIYQLFTKASTIVYWENFAEHAFENTTQNFFQATTLQTEKGDIPCAACVTIRRDVFDLPSIIIGQFLPIPEDAMV